MAILAVSTAAFERRRQSKASDLERRRAMVREVIQRLEIVARKQARPIYGRLWANPAQEFALASAHLTLLISKDEEPLVAWLNSQVLRMQAARSDRAATLIAVQAAVELASWLRGSRPLSWFEEGTATTPLPRKSRLRPFSNSLELVSSTFIMGATAAAVLSGAAWVEERVTSRRRSTN